MKPQIPLSTAMIVQIADVEIRTIMDHAFAGEFMLTPVLHSHPFYELICTLDGEFAIGFADGSSIPIRKHSLCILPPDLYHRTYTDAPPVRKLALQFDYRRTDSTLQPVYNSFHEALSRVTAPVLLDDCRQICLLMEKIRGEMLEKPIGADVMRQSLMTELYITVMRLLRADSAEGAVSGGDDGRNLRYMQIERFFSVRHNSPITADDLAAELGLSRRQTDRVFLELYGMTFRERLVELRMTLAAHLLTTTDLPVETVAEQVGYTSLSGFYVAFRGRFGVGASEYRRSVAETFENETSFS